MQEFKTLREFNNKFPSKFYLCPNCKRIITNPQQCEFCFFQANNITNQNYKFKIQELNLIGKILPPIELYERKKMKDLP